MEENHKGMLVGGLIVVVCLIVFGYANSLVVILPVLTTQMSCIIFGIIGGAIVVFSGLKELR